MTTTTDIDAISSATTLDEASDVLRSILAAVNRGERPLAHYRFAQALWWEVWGAEERKRSAAAQCQHLTTRSNYTGD